VRQPIVLKFHLLVLCGSEEARELSKSTSGQIPDGRRHSDFKYPFSEKAKDFKLGVYSDYEELI